MYTYNPLKDNMCRPPHLPADQGAMPARTRLLHVEDEVTDSDLVGVWLQEAGLNWEVVRVDTREAFVKALENEPFDIILSDFQLPAFNGLEALKETRARRPDLAFV